MANDQGWIVQIPVARTDRSSSPDGLLHVTATGTDLAAACQDLGVEQVLVFMDPNSDAGRIVFAFDGDTVPESATGSLAALCMEGLARLQFQNALPQLTITGDMSFAWNAG